MIDTQNRPLGFLIGVLAFVVDVENIHAVVVIPNAARPIVGFQAQVGVGGCFGIQRVTGGMQNLVLVARRQDHVVDQAFIDRSETQGADRCWQRSTHGDATRQQSQTGQSQATQQKFAPLGVR